MVNPEFMSFQNPAFGTTVKICIVLIATFFTTQYVLTRRTWISPLAFLLLGMLLWIPAWLSIDLWQDVPGLRPILLALILSFFAASPFLEWLEEKRIEIQGQKLFRKCAREISLAFQAMARERIGAMTAIEREDSLDEICKKGIPVGGEVTKEVLATLFTPYTPTHDGGMIIRDRKIAACGCVFPLSANETLSKDLGTRHRAGLGLAEKSDALVLIASEETGEIAIASYGKLEHDIAPGQLEKKILQELGQTRHKTKLNAPLLARKRLSISKHKARSSTALEQKILLASGALFFACLFTCFFPKVELSASHLALYLKKNPWGWIFAIPVLTSTLLLVRASFSRHTLFDPESRRVERRITFLTIPIFKRAYAYEKLKGLNILSSPRWTTLFELRLQKSRFVSWLITESKNLGKLEEARLALDPPRVPTNFGA